MALKTLNPVTSASRGVVLIDRSSLWTGRPLKALTCGKKSSGGRNARGRITSRHKGGGHKKLYRFIDFARNKTKVPAVVERIEYDPNRTSFIALIKYEDGEFSYIVAPQNLKTGDVVESGEEVGIKIGNCLFLRSIPVGTVVHNVELKIGKGGQIARSAGTSAQIVGRDSGKIVLRLSSGETRIVSGDCRATIGAVSNPDQKNINLGKAGRNRWLGVRPSVRGVAMNPVDHPHGGGEGKTKGGRHPVTPWGIPTKGYKTRRKTKPSDRFILSGRKK
ncbi:MAG: 50S ribosomal protein L2 [Holosporales bacterium]|jgi:large subunit ribosomal protein L2|nr:50S ribosomal protein L2 [Holosporales bacterium]